MTAKIALWRSVSTAAVTSNSSPLTAFGAASFSSRKRHSTLPVAAARTISCTSAEAWPVPTSLSNLSRARCTGPVVKSGQDDHGIVTRWPPVSLAIELSASCSSREKKRGHLRPKPHEVRESSGPSRDGSHASRPAGRARGQRGKAVPRTSSRCTSCK